LRTLHDSSTQGYEIIDLEEVLDSLRTLLRMRRLEFTRYGLLATTVMECALANPRTSVRVPAALNHGDFTLSNLLWDKKFDQLWVIDFELAAHRPILHDLGKVKEISGPTAPEFTVPGQLLGHVVLGWEMVREEARAMEFPDANLLIQLEHIILAHHGALEFGSPIPPKTREALLVYVLDDLNAKLKMMSQHLESDSGSGDFTSYHRVLQRGIYKGGEAKGTGEPQDQEQK
jgi:hypothetical protein